jgi:ParB-like nuclease domain
MSKKNSEQVRGSIIYLSVDDLEFDPQNPRLPVKNEVEDESGLFKYMLLHASLTELMSSIGQQGYFSGEPLLVFPSENVGGKYWVGEGNRRLAAVKLLNDPTLAPVKQTTVKLISAEKVENITQLPVLIYPDRKSILNYLGYRHITGVEEWDALAKAKYMRQLYEMQTEEARKGKVKSIAKIIGSTSPYVSKVLDAYTLYEKIADNKFYGIDNLSENTIDFSLLTLATTYTGISEFLGINERDDFEEAQINEVNLEEFSNWVLKKIEKKSRVGDSRNFTELNEVLKSGGKALELFRDGKSLREAIAFTNFPLEGFREILASVKQSLSAAQNQLVSINKFDETDRELTREVLNLSRDISSIINSRIASQEEEG